MMGREPLIGLSTYRRSIELCGDPVDLVGLTQAYFHAVRLAGGIPVLIPQGMGVVEGAALLNRLDGLILPGGDDVNPDRYGEPKLPACGDIDDQRDSLEFKLIQRALETELPFLAICRGLQVLNIAMGGTLWQDLASQVPSAFRHSYFGARYRNFLAHTITIKNNSILQSILDQDQVATNSSHHQAVKDVAPGLVVTGRSPDGIVEALEVKGHPFGLALQWHPEGMLIEYPDMLKPFRALIHAAKK